MVDENADRLEEAKMLLDWSNYGISSIITAGSYVEAVDKAMDLTPHIALVSLHLGKYEGYELAAHMRSIGLSTIFCILAEENDPELIRASMRCGVQDYLLYPLHAEEMQHFLARTLAHHLDGTQPEIGEAKKRLDPVLGVEYTDLSKITNKIILLVRSNFRAPQTLTAIAAELNMSAKYIGRVGSSSSAPRRKSPSLPIWWDTSTSTTSTPTSKRISAYPPARCATTPPPTRRTVASPL